MKATYHVFLVIFDLCFFAVAATTAIINKSWLGLLGALTLAGVAGYHGEAAWRQMLRAIRWNES